MLLGWEDNLNLTLSVENPHQDVSSSPINNHVSRKPPKQDREKIELIRTKAPGVLINYNYK